MVQKTLTGAFIKSITCTSGVKKTDFFDTDCKGLTLVVHQSGRKTYSLRYQDKRGKTRQYRLADEADVNLTEAKSLASKMRNQIAMGNDPSEMKSVLKKVPTMSEFIDEYYLPYVKGYKRSWPTDEGLLRNHVKSCWGKRHMDDISKQDVVKLITNQRQTHKPGSCNRLLILLRYVFNLAVKWDVAGVTTNPTHGLSLMEENNKKERFLTKEEASTLYGAVIQSDNTMLKFIIPMLILTGARKREVLDAKWEDFNLEQQQWRISISKSGKARHVPLSDQAIQLLKTVPQYQKCDWVFANPKTHEPYVSIFCSWNTARKQAGLSDVRIHDLRHSFASFLVNAGRSIYEVQKILGHTQIKTTQRYAHLSQDSLIAAANEVPNVIEFRTLPVIEATNDLVFLTRA